MRFKKIMMLTIILACLIAVSTVSASENAADDIISADVVGVDKTSDEIVSIQENQVINQTDNDVISSKDDGTFTALQNKINTASEGSTINLENNYEYDDGFTTEGITISKSLTINGNGHAIDALSTSRIFSIKSDSVINLNNINFTHGNGGGAAIYSSGDGNLIIRNCNFISNYGESNGGAIIAYGDLYVYDSYFGGNSAYEYRISMGQGGAISSSKLLVVDNCIFNGNSAYELGGAIYSRSGSVIINNSIFSSNSADHGGAVSAYDMKIYNSNFSSNWAYEKGGAIRSSGGVINEMRLNINNCIFEKNHANNYGGAIEWAGYYGKVESSIFKYNSANNGDAIYWDSKYGIITNCISYTESNEENNVIVGEGTIEGFDVILKSRYSIFCSDLIKYYGGQENYSVILTEDNNAISDATVKITANGVLSNVTTDFNGQASLNLNLPVGTYDIVSEYDDVSNSSKVTILPTVSVNDITGEYLNSKVTATFLDTTGNALTSKQVAFKVGDKTYDATTNSNGVATANVDLDVGNYVVTAVNPVNNEQKQFKLVVNKAKSAISLAFNQNNGVTTLTASSTPSSATGKVVFNVNGEDKTVSIKNGKATLTLSDLNPGNYTATASYSGDNNFNASTSNTVNFNVAKAYPVLTADPVTKTYGAATKLVVNLADSKGNKILDADVKVVIDNVEKTIKTNANGQAAIEITNAPGTYDATITYADAKTTAKITVKKATPKITAKAKTFKKSDKSKKYTVTLKNNKKLISGATVKITVNKKTYTAKTKKGVATFKLKKLTKKGTFKATVKFAGSKYYNSKTVKNVKITVK